MIRVKQSEICIPPKLDSLVNLFTINKRLKNELRVWLHLQQLKFTETNAFILSTFPNILGNNLKIQIDGDFADYHTIMIYNGVPKNRQTIVFENNLVKIKLEYTSAYPFKSPTDIKINGHDYILLLKSNHNHLSQLGLEDRCLCCSTCVCLNNWSVTYDIQYLLDEIDRNLKIKKAIFNLIHCNVIKRKYLIDDIPLMDYLFTSN